MRDRNSSYSVEQSRFRPPKNLKCRKRPGLLTRTRKRRHDAFRANLPVEVSLPLSENRIVAGEDSPEGNTTILGDSLELSRLRAEALRHSERSINCVFANSVISVPPRERSVVMTQLEVGKCRGQHGRRWRNREKARCACAEAILRLTPSTAGFECFMPQFPAIHVQNFRIHYLSLWLPLLS